MCYFNLIIWIPFGLTFLNTLASLKVNQTRNNSASDMIKWGNIMHSNVVNRTSDEIFNMSEWLSSYIMKVETTHNQSKRVKRSAQPLPSSKGQYPICPPIDAFEVINYENLRCPDLVAKQEGKYQRIDTKRILPLAPMAKPRICTCVQQKYVRWCFKRFLDSDQTSERISKLEPTRMHCQNLCDDMLRQGKTELIHGSIPEYACWWMKGTTTEGIVTTIRAVNVLLNRVTSELTNQFLLNGKCLWGSLDCRFQGGAYVIFPSKFELVSQFKDGDYSTETFEYRKIKGGDMLLLRSIVAKTAYNVKECCIHYGPYCLSPSIRGNLFDMTGHWKKNPTLATCPSSLSTVAPPISAGIIEDPDVSSLYKEELFCHLTKQSILNSVKIGVPIAKRLLSVFNTDEAHPSITTMYYLSSKSLVSADCVMAEYDDVEYYCPDIWVIKRMGSQIGCYDARANIAFAAKCKCYPEQSVSYLMNKYIVKGANGSYNLEQYDYPESEVVEELTLLAQGYKDLLSYIQTPSGIIIYEDPIIKNTHEDQFQNQTYATVNLFGDFFGWFQKFKDVVLSIMGLVVGGILLYFLIKICLRCKKTHRRHRDFYDDEQDLILDRDKDNKRRRRRHIDSIRLTNRKADNEN